MKEPLTVHYELSGDAKMGEDYAERYGTTTIPAGRNTALITLDLRSSATDNRTVVISLIGGEGVNVGCPAQSLIVIRR